MFIKYLTIYILIYSEIISNCGIGGIKYIFPLHVVILYIFQQCN